MQLIPIFIHCNVHYFTRVDILQCTLLPRGIGMHCQLICNNAFCKVTFGLAQNRGVQGVQLQIPNSKKNEFDLNPSVR